MKNNHKNDPESQKTNNFQNFSSLEKGKITKATSGTWKEKAEYLAEEVIEVTANCLGYNLFK
jgi:hypothetical protein